MTWPPRNKCADEKRPYGEGEEEEAGEEESREEPLKSAKSEGGLDILQSMVCLWKPLGGKWKALEPGQQIGELVSSQILCLGRGD